MAPNQQSSLVFPLLGLLYSLQFSLISLASAASASAGCKSNNIPYLVKDLTGGPRDSNPKPLASIGNTLFFTINPFSSGNQLWKTDSTMQGTVLLTDVAIELDDGWGTRRKPAYITTTKLFFFISRDGELWRSDGTRRGTFQLKDINPGVYSAKIRSLTKVENTIYFTAENGSLGRELWKTDGTSEGTLLVKDIMPGVDDSAPSHLTAVGSRLYFKAAINLPRLGPTRLLWFTEGSENSTSVITLPDTPSAVSFEAYQINNLIGSDNTLYFTMNGEANGEEIWKVNELKGKASVVSDILPSQTSMGLYGYGHLRVLNNSLFFIHNDKSLWRTNGTVPTTIALHSFDDIAKPYDEFASIAIGDSLYFVAESKQFGEELWKSDGTIAGTLLVKDINPGSYGSSPQELVSISNMLYFTAKNGVSGRELWKTDGTENGTKLIKDIFPGGESYTDYWPKDLTPVGNLLYFTAGNRNVNRQLWKTDGTEKGTVLVSPVPGGLPGFKPWYLKLVGSKLYFSADGGLSSGRELWAVSITCSKK
jgi:ELWxxDGT repeat protein